MHALVKFDRELRKLFQSPFSDQFGLLKNVHQEDLFSANKEYSISKVNDQGIWNIELPFPGLTENEIQVKLDLENRQLTVVGHKDEESEQNNENVTYTRKAELNRRFSFFIDEQFDLNTIDAHCQNGILNIKMKELKATDQSPKLVEVQVKGPKD